MAAEESYAIGLAVGMEYVDGVMKTDTSWTTAVCITDGPTDDVQVVAKTQALSNSSDIFKVISDVLKDLLKKVNPESVTRVNIATPQVLDEALKKNLSKVTAVRLCGSASQSLLPFTNIPEEIQEKLKGDICLLDGGYEFCRDVGANLPIKPVNTSEVLQCIADIGESDYDNVVICGVYSPDNPDQEYQVGQLFEKQNPNLNVTLSHKVVNQIGLLERENTSILNAGLKNSFKNLAAKFKQTLQEVNLNVPFYFVQNEANLVGGDDQSEFPFPVKSFFGNEASTMNACIKLEKDLKNYMVINIAGTASTTGVVKNGAVELQTPTIQVAGFPIFKHAVTSVSHGIGMFSKVHNPESESTLRIGPDTVATSTDSLVFGGDELTVLDVAVKAKLIQMGDPTKVSLDAATIERILTKFSEMIASLIDSAKNSPDKLPVVIVGIGNVLIDETKPLPGASEVVKPQEAMVATAIGAALLSATTIHFADFVYSPLIDPFEYLAHDRHVFRHPTPRVFRQSLPKPELRSLLTSHHRQTLSAVAANKSSDDPIIQNGEWLLQEIDLEYISVGAGILGSGGGGSPLLGKLMAINQLKKGKKIRVKVPERMSDNSLAVITAMMGSPGVLLEKYPNGTEGIDSLTLMEDLYKCGYNIDDGSLKWKPAGTVEQSTESRVDFIEDFPSVYNSPIVSEHKFEGLLAVESGGFNTMQALVVGAETDQVVFDCDGQGRSVPDLQMIGPIMYGTPIYPATLTGDKGQRVVALHSENPKDVEDFFRIETTKMGYISAITFAPLTKDVVDNNMVKYTISKAWRLGKEITDAQTSGGDPIQSILDSENGQILIRDGKVTNLTQTNREGFTVGGFTVSNGSDNVTIEYQNENLVAWEGTEADPSSNSKVLASTPDLISLVDNSGHPITTELLYYGVRLTVIAMPCSPLLKTSQALKFIGPEAVGYDFNYKPMATNPPYKPADPVPPLPSN